MIWPHDTLAHEISVLVIGAGALSLLWTFIDWDCSLTRRSRFYTEFFGGKNVQRTLGIIFSSLILLFGLYLRFGKIPDYW